MTLKIERRANASWLESSILHPMNRHLQQVRRDVGRQEAFDKDRDQIDRRPRDDPSLDLH